jgi:hypothetical protein
MGLTSSLIERDTYSLGGILLAGKLHAHNSFPHVPGYHGWQWYYHIYNCLGDPELSIRTDTPKTMTATYNENIMVGTNYLDIHVDADGGGPLEGAYVCLVKGEGVDEEVFVGGWTDEAGDITFEIRIRQHHRRYDACDYQLQKLHPSSGYLPGEFSDLRSSFQRPGILRR